MKKKKSPSQVVSVETGMRVIEQEERKWRPIFGCVGLIGLCMVIWVVYHLLLTTK